MTLQGSYMQLTASENRLDYLKWLSNGPAIQRLGVRVPRLTL